MVRDTFQRFRLTEKGKELIAQLNRIQAKKTKLKYVFFPKVSSKLVFTWLTSFGAFSALLLVVASRHIYFRSSFIILYLFCLKVRCGWQEGAYPPKGERNGHPRARPEQQGSYRLLFAPGIGLLSR